MGFNAGMCGEGLCAQGWVCHTGCRGGVCGGGCEGQATPWPREGAQSPTLAITVALGQVKVHPGPLPGLV